jgi:hypothetical protein
MLLEAHPERALWEIPVWETKDLRPEKSPKPWFPDGPLAVSKGQCSC